MSEAIHTEALTKRYRRVRALDDVSLQIPEGAIYALVGPNGAGKTTAVKILMNLISATSGYAKVLGIDSRKIRGTAYNKIGYVSENQEIPEWMRVGELLGYLREFYPTWDPTLESSLLKAFDLPRDHRIKQLSRGMKMKLALASALAFHPTLIVLDEPFGGLDPLVRDQLIEGLLERAAEATIFLSSHDLAEIESFASHVGYLEQGKLRFSEEMTSLVARFREVELTFENEASRPQQLPQDWLQFQAAAGIVRFVDSTFDQRKTDELIRRLFVSARNVAYRPMSLRAIFLAMARRVDGTEET
jgi:ABC-2 type transport system ATP-binding protein